MILWIAIILLAPYIFIFLPTRVIGKKFIKRIKKQPSIIGCNHQTNNDAIFLKIRVSRKAKFMAKSELFKNKLFGGILKRLGGYPVNRGGNDIQAVKTTLGYLKDNKQIVIFPEGTRVKANDSAELKNGLVMFALKTDCYVIPMIFRKTTKPFIFNTLLIGKPFKFSEHEAFNNVKITKETLNQASEVLMKKMNYLKNVNIKEYKKLIKTM